MWNDRNENVNTKNVVNIIVPCKVKLLVNPVTVYTGAGFEYVTADSVSKEDLPEIVEVKVGKNEKM